MGRRVVTSLSASSTRRYRRVRRPCTLRRDGRELRLAGYEVYLFGGREIADRDRAPGLLDDFFTRLLAD